MSKRRPQTPACFASFANCCRQRASLARVGRPRRKLERAKIGKITTFDATVAGEFKKLPSIIVNEKNFNDEVLYLYL